MSKNSKTLSDGRPSLAPLLTPGLLSLMQGARMIYLLSRMRNAKAGDVFSASKLLEANMKNRFERAGVNDAFANLLSELKHDVKDIARHRGDDARETLATLLDDVAGKVRTNTRRVSSHLRGHDTGTNFGKVALVLGIAGLVGVLFAAGSRDEDTPQTNP